MPTLPTSGGKPGAGRRTRGRRPAASGAGAAGSAKSAAARPSAGPAAARPGAAPSAVAGRRSLARKLGLKLALATLLTLALAVLFWTVYVVHAINLVAAQDQAQPADAIAVFGAAEYAGRPSPVYHARLDHAAELYARGIAPLVITFGGGADRNSGLSEGGVGRDYLLAHGVPFDHILAETESTSTAQQVMLLARIAHARQLEHIVLVSDNTHLFRIAELCRRQGLDVFTSPRPSLGHIDRYDLGSRYFHEIVSYTALRLGLTRTWNWVEGRPED